MTPLDRGFNRINNRLIACATAIIARNVLTDFFPARDMHFLHQGSRSKQHAGCAKAALHRVVLKKGLLKDGKFTTVGQCLNGLDLPALSLNRQHEAAANQFTID
jgi:hypothetical protein